MTDLQIALTAIGVALIAIVYVHNKWQEAKYRREADVALKSGHSDVLLQSSAPPAASETSRVEPTWPTAGESGYAGEGRPAPEAASVEESLTEAIDFIVALRKDEQISGRLVLDAANSELTRFGRRMRLEGATSAGWSAVVPEQSYSEVRVGLQLVDRKGAVRDEDLAAFAAAVARVAAAAGANSTGAPRDAALDTAARLDRFCEQVDIQIAVHVVSVDADFAGTKVGALAEAAGLTLERDGRFHRRDEQGLELFVLANEGTGAFSAEAMKTVSTPALLLELDVPRAPGGADAFAQFRGFAEQFAAALGGRLADDNRAPLDAIAFEAITAQLAPVYESMRAQGIPAGSPLALRLFS